MPLPGKTQPKSEKKSMPLPYQTQQKYDNPHMFDKTKNIKCEGLNTFSTFLLGLVVSHIVFAGLAYLTTIRLLDFPRFMVRTPVVIFLIHVIGLFFNVFQGFWFPLILLIHLCLLFALSLAIFLLPDFSLFHFSLNFLGLYLRTWQVMGFCP